MARLELWHTDNHLRGGDLPEWLKSDHNIRNPVPSKYNLCGWDSLAMSFVDPKERYVELAKKLFREFYTEHNYFTQRSASFNIKNEEGFERKKKQIIAKQVEEKLKNYKSMTFKEMDAIEEHFKCAISVVELKEDNRTIFKRWSEKEDALGIDLYGSINIIIIFHL